MGNCLHHGSSSSSSMQWGGDDWGSSSAKSGRGRDHDHDHYHHKGVEDKEEEEGRLLDDTDGFMASSTTKTTTEVKIKITKKQLEELLGRAELKQLSVHQVLAQLMNVSDR
ncbi:hypothetical protein JRO89_XS15G0158400 [Xanthoceras sorbifolium]|uniref:Uncharacterized protein n=1 Tax=Xanthoceras sorbifolium TaxID=99658 RepID=A0ABQ8H2G8_9ROSI|nr:hypothetical protein JRO89_XS15G0158400 [Xanthoceras sorbifolium]